MSLAMDELRLLHISDVHLGGSGPAFGARVAEHQQRLAEAFARCVDLALFHRVQAVCIAGDLFDSQRPSERVLQAAVAELRRLLAASPPVECFLLPGTHDAVGPASIYLRPEFRLPGLHVWDATGPRGFTGASGALAVHGNPQPAGAREHRPLAGLAADPSATWNVALAHGSVAGGGFTEEDRAVIQPAEIAACGMDYVALGHWHPPSDESRPPVTCWYSGATEVVALDQREPGGALLVTLGRGATSVERLTTGVLRTEALMVDVEAHPDESAVASAIAVHTDPTLLLDVTLAGLAPEGFACDLASLQDQLASGFFRLRLTDATIAAADPAAIDPVAGRLVAARAVERLRKTMDDALAAGDEAGAGTARRALQLTAALFDGREVLR